MAIKRFAVFYGGCLLLLVLVPLSAMVAGGSLDFDRAAADASSAAGIEWTSNLAVVFRLSWEEPILLLTLLGSIVPTLAALLAAAYFRREGDFQRLLRRMTWKRQVEPLAALKFYGLIVVVLVPSLVCALALKISLGMEVTSSLFTLGPGVIVWFMLAALLDQGAILEEIGWRGYASPELQRFVEPIWAALVVGVCWGLWHIPRDLTTGVVDRLGWLNWMVFYLPSFVLGTVAVSVIAGYFVNRLGGVVLPAIVVHGITNDSAGISGAVPMSEALTPLHQLAKNLPLALVALAIVLHAGRSLGRTQLE